MKQNLSLRGRSGATGINHKNTIKWLEREGEKKNDSASLRMFLEELKSEDS